MIWIVSHDAGGAEILSSWARRRSDQKYGFILEGPAVSIFRKKLPYIEILSRAVLLDLPPSVEMVVTGTGWGSDLEAEAISLSRRQQKKVASFLDHWAKFPERFLYHGLTVLPDEIWVGDEYAMKIARAYPDFEGKIRFVQNPYFLDIQEEFSQKAKLISHTRDKMDRVRILYICESVSEISSAKEGFSSLVGGDLEAIRRFFSWLSSEHSEMKLAEIRLRPHPAEMSGKYDALEGIKNGHSVGISRGNSLVDDCLWSDWVVGMSSMALVVALLGGKKVFSCIPEGWYDWRLPHAGITNYRIP